MAISEQTWEYWNYILKQSEYTGSLYDPLPAKINCNISNVNNPEEQVAGYFTLGNVVKKRFFIYSEDLDPVVFFRSDCISYEIWADNPWGDGDAMGWPDLFEDNSPCCFECEICEGTSRIKPDFW